MAQPVSKAPHREINNHSQGKSGAETMKHPGPAKGKRGVVNPTAKGGIFRPTKGQM